MYCSAIRPPLSENEVNRVERTWKRMLPVLLTVTEVGVTWVVSTPVAQCDDRQECRINRRHRRSR